MEQQKEISYQLSLEFSDNTEAVSPVQEIPDVFRDDSGKGLQVISASSQGRVLAQEDLMQHVCSPANMSRAFAQVKRNKGGSGIDGQSIDEFLQWYREEGPSLLSTLYNGNYQPSGIKQVEIPKANGGYRKLGIPTIKDRVIQQAIHQVLSPLFDPYFSKSSFGFREKRTAHQALRQGKEYVRSGNYIVVDIDLKNFFDKVNHDRLLHRLSQVVMDKVLLGLIRKYLQTGVMLGGLVSQRLQGTPQGSPLSPLLSNIVLDELDKELERRGHKFCRYADDCNIYVRSQRAGERVMSSISNFIETRLKLQINRDKSKVVVSREAKFLGYRISEGGALTIHPHSLSRLKKKIRGITKRNRGYSFVSIISDLTASLRGWYHYYKHQEWRSDFVALDGWIRRRLRCYRLKQCQRTYGIVRLLTSHGIKESRAWSVAAYSQGWWAMSSRTAVSRAMNNYWLEEHGLFNLTRNYDALQKL